MSSKIEVSREFGEQILSELTSGAVSVGTGAKLRALLAAHVVERQPVGWIDPYTIRAIACNPQSRDRFPFTANEDRANGYTMPLYAAPPELAELQATIETERKFRLAAEGGWREANRVIAMQREKLDAQEAELERLKGGQGEPVAYFCREIGEGDWRPCTKEDYERYSAYPEMDTKTSQPAPVSVPDGWKLVPIEPTELMIHRGDQNYSWSVAKIYAAMIADAPACLDKVKEMNQ